MSEFTRQVTNVARLRAIDVKYSIVGDGRQRDTTVQASAYANETKKLAWKVENGCQV